MQACISNRLRSNRMQQRRAVDAALGRFPAARSRFHRSVCCWRCGKPWDLRFAVWTSCMSEVIRRMSITDISSDVYMDQVNRKMAIDMLVGLHSGISYLIKTNGTDVRCQRFHRTAIHPHHSWVATGDQPGAGRTGQGVCLLLLQKFWN